MASNMEVGDYDLRGPDFETYLIGPVTPDIGDAARRIKGNGFPNWAMYRCAYAGDALLLADLRAWCEAIGLAHAFSGGLRKPTEAIALCGGRDAFCFVVWRRWGAPAEEIAEALGVAPNTYRRFREALAKRLEASLQNYWVALGSKIREVALDNRKLPEPTLIGRHSPGRGLHGDIDFVGDGNFRAGEQILR